MVVFDLDDTLYEYERCEEAGRAAVFRFANDELGVMATEFAAAYDAGRTAVKSRLGPVASSHSRLLYCHEALESVGLRSEPLIALAMEQEFWREYILTMRLRPGVLDLLQRLRFHGVPIAIVTDLTAQIQFRKLAYLDIARLIDHIVCSEETQGEKTTLAPFRLLFSRVPASQRESVWFIGDNPNDAPIAALRDEGLIGTGFGLVRGSTRGQDVSPWLSVADIDRALKRVLPD